MKPFSDFFRPYAPLVKPVVSLAIKSCGENGNYKLRPLWMGVDILSMYDWKNNGETIMNWPESRRNSPLVYHYLKFLRSSNMQSLMVTHNDQSFMQLDVLPVTETAFAGHFDHQWNDCCLFYFCPYTFRNKNGIVCCLEVFLEYYFSFDSPGALYLPIPAESKSIREEAKIVGFEYLSRIEWAHESCLVFRLKK
jgi:hypothetical protein